MARRQQRRPAFRQPRPQQDRAEEEARLDAGARRLLGHYDPQAIERMIGDLRLLRDEADRIAYEQPSPDSLQRYRRAARELAEAERALNLSSR
ncbi:MAG: hypothetical protein HYX52_02785 [Chloroflexi bacterium]|nr:hypothetical protein [Chloroflexota bacterium]